MSLFFIVIAGYFLVRTCMFLTWQYLVEVCPHAHLSLPLPFLRLNHVPLYGQTLIYPPFPYEWTYQLFPIFFKDFIYLFLERGREGENQCVVASCAPPTGDLARNPGVTVNRTGDSLVLRPALSPLSHTARACFQIFIITCISVLYIWVNIFEDTQNVNSCVFIILTRPPLLHEFYPS